MTASLLSMPRAEKKLHRSPIIPLTLDERMDIEQRELRVPATLDEYFAIVQDMDYAVHYRHGHIISFIEFDEENGQPMGIAAALHERLVALLIYLISDVLDIRNSEYQGYGSNIKLYIEGAMSAYNPDVAFTKGDAVVQKIRPKGRKRNTQVLMNPHILIEVLSKSTKNFDLTEKWEDYKKIESLQQMIFVEQDTMNIKTYIRQNENLWLPIELTNINDALPIFGKETKISLSDIYAVNMLK